MIPLITAMLVLTLTGLAFADVTPYTSILTDGIKSYFSGMATDVSFASSSVLSVVLIIIVVGFIIAAVSRR